MSKQPTKGRVVLSVLTAVGGLLASYLAFSFICLDFNPSAWGYNPQVPGSDAFIRFFALLIGGDAGGAPQIGIWMD